MSLKEDSTPAVSDYENEELGEGVVIDSEDDEKVISNSFLFKNVDWCDEVLQDSHMLSYKVPVKDLEPRLEVTCEENFQNWFVTQSTS